MKVLITGASGFVGQATATRLSANNRFDLTGTYHSKTNTSDIKNVQIDLTDKQSTLELIEQVQPRVIIHAATSHNSVASIETVAQNVVQAANAVHAHLIAFSTDLVFDGTQPPYSEKSSPTPLNAYAKAKAASDKIIQDYAAHFTLIRTSLIYDFLPDSQQLKWMLEKVNAGERVSLFVDEVRQPIWVHNLAEVIEELTDRQPLSTINIAGPESLDRFIFGSKLLQYAGLDPSVHVSRVKSADLGLSRPQNCTLDLTYASKQLETTLMTVDEAFDIYAGKHKTP